MIYLINFIIIGIAILIIIGILLYLSKQEEKREYLNVPKYHDDIIKEEN